MPKATSPPDTSHTTAKHTRAFVKIIERLDTSRHLWNTFQTFVRIAACTIHQAPYHHGLCPRDDIFASVEEQYMQAIKGYTRDQLNQFAQLLTITHAALNEERSDFLGHVFMTLELGSKDRGQFFTPYPLSRLIATATLGNLDSLLSERGFFTLAEPACGAGGMIIAAGQHVEDEGHDPSACMFFVGTDLSLVAADMTYLQTSLCGLSGIIRHGNTLSNEIYHSWFTPICRAFPHRTRAFLAYLNGPTDNAASEPADTVPVSIDPPSLHEPDQPTLLSLPVTNTTPTKPAAKASIRPTPQEQKQFVQGNLFS